MARTIKSKKGDLVSKKFNGKNFFAMGFYMYKRMALRGKKIAQKKGYSTRIVRYKGIGKIKYHYRLFIRKK